MNLARKRAVLAAGVAISVKATAAWCVVYVVLFVLFFTAGQMWCGDMQYSAFYDAQRHQRRLAQRDSLNEQRATAFMDDLIASPPQRLAVPSHANQSSAPVRLCVVVVTFPRTRPYLYQTLASLLTSTCDLAGSSACPTRLSSSQPALPVHVLYSHTNDYPAFDALDRAQLPLVLTSRQQHNSSEGNSTFLQSELSDYVAALTLCEAELSAADRPINNNNAHGGNNRTDLLLVLEDDVVATQHAVDKLLVGVQPLLNSDDWLLVRLYASRHWDGWQKSDWPLFTLLFVTAGLLGAFIPAALSTALFSSHSRKSDEEGLVGPVHPGHLVRLLDSYTSPSQQHRAAAAAKTVCRRLQPFVIRLGPLFVLSGMLWLTALLLLNKQNLPLLTSPTPLPGLTVVQPTAGTQAMLFASRHLPALRSFLLAYAHPIHLPIDLALNWYAEAAGLLQYHLVPDLFDHRGLVSTDPAKADVPYTGLHTSSSFVDEAVIPDRSR